MPHLAVHPEDTREGIRKNLFVAAVLRSETGQAPVRVRNLSSKGAMIETSVAPSAGATVELRRGSLQASARVAWQQGSRCGLEFQSSVDVDEWIGAVHGHHQRSVDQAVNLVRTKPGEATQRARPSASEQAPEDMLALLAKLLRITTGRLSIAPGLLCAHASELQYLDMAAEALGMAARHGVGSPRFASAITACLAALQQADRSELADFAPEWRKL